MIKVESGVPLPPVMRRGKPAKYPWRTMGVGHSFFTVEAKATTLSAMGLRYKPKCFTARNVLEGGVSGVRVWRVK